ncbi:DUF1810 domain-containing protein [Lapillicoccus jejuensis]|uniref:Uncharacterized protein (DUF1810 family) n=1 Tax=Lapillicoccus jejuensis TaxID=402171 RepID=A0A542DVT0_9MICO|nr:DUF1810 domain-containing protein [Lapillicoccus jejuensis]TQJ07198.1 uncharacterized protein (DUF1810 family) [Lapillicoccus jejuensis]
MSDLSPDPERFVTAQDEHGTYDAALAELRRGRKTSHWMWFVLPQLLGLGQSAMAQRYGVRGLAEARAYLAHPVLGPRLRECGEALLALGTSDVESVLGGIDAMKLRSSMTLFAHAADGEADVFRAVLDRFFDGDEDEATLALLDGRSGLSGRAATP